ncbi:SDR family oxidoreductase [Paenibacillus sp. KQZ6P-2]|uniref:SDR family oxidoreductase n=1 Tax=Paenibacillus mangrovi TaxID=2931978 RepID=A0A9X1WLI1_9BACL|nr:SDR family oxidoreductase [Paenibacillus mangrovi]MCJ8011487.1 SDR family oxidoreductase [Paenibacillus mangrovi]
MSITGKIAIITGSTSGIGEATAITLASQGATVLVCGRDTIRGEEVLKIIRDQGGQAEFVSCDLLDPQAPERIVEEAIRLWGRIDIVVNNAAMVSNKVIDNISMEDWDRLLQVNLKAPFFLIQSALPFLRESKGTVINVSSINAIRNLSNNLIYDTIKAGLNHMTQGLAKDLLKDGIRINAVMPGGTKTPLLKEWWQHMTMDASIAEQLYIDACSDPNNADPQQIASVIAFLASEQASWVNGAIIPINNGVHL